MRTLVFQCAASLFPRPASADAKAREVGRLVGAAPLRLWGWGPKALGGRAPASRETSYRAFLLHEYAESVRAATTGMCRCPVVRRGGPAWRACLERLSVCAWVFRLPPNARAPSSPLRSNDNWDVAIPRKRAGQFELYLSKDYFLKEFFFFFHTLF